MYERTVSAFDRVRITPLQYNMSVGKARVCAGFVYEVYISLNFHALLKQV